MATNLNRAIRWHRRSLDMSQTKLGKIVGATFATVSSWEKGYTKPSIDQLMMMSQLFGVSETDLLHFPEIKKELPDMK